MNLIQKSEVLARSQESLESSESLGWAGVGWAVLGWAEPTWAGLGCVDHVDRYDRIDRHDRRSHNLP